MAQKGFLLYEGCFEHTFLLSTRRRKKIGLAWRMLLVWYHVGVHKRAGTDWMYFGRGEGHLYRFDYEGKDR